MKIEFYTQNFKLATISFVVSDMLTIIWSLKELSILKKLVVFINNDA